MISAGYFCNICQLICYCYIHDVSIMVQGYQEKHNTKYSKRGTCPSCCKRLGQFKKHILSLIFYDILTRRHITGDYYPGYFFSQCAMGAGGVLSKSYNLIGSGSGRNLCLFIRRTTAVRCLSVLTIDKWIGTSQWTTRESQECSPLNWIKRMKSIWPHFQSHELQQFRGSANFALWSQRGHRTGTNSTVDYGNHSIHLCVSIVPGHYRNAFLCPWNISCTHRVDMISEEPH